MTKHGARTAPPPLGPRPVNTQILDFMNSCTLTVTSKARNTTHTETTQHCNTCEIRHHATD
eukprot:1393098-Lingulodinium_polyedra.AAC.1